MKNDDISILKENLLNKENLIKNLKTELNLRVNELYSLVEACTFINSVMKLDDLLQLIMDLAAKTTNAEASSLFLVDENTNELYIPIAHGSKKKEIKQVRIPIDKGIVGFVIKTNKPLLIQDVENDQRFYQEADKITNFKTKNIIAAPLTAKDKIIGAVEVINKKNDDFFNQNDVTLLCALANQAAICIENVRLYEDVIKEKKKIESIVSSMEDGIIVQIQKMKYPL
jgi:GAF domain-containing protein